MAHYAEVSTRLLLVRLFFALGLALLGAGLVFGLLPVRPDGARCGSAFRSGYDDNPYMPTGPVCDERRAAARTPAVLLLVLGTVVLVPAVVLAASRDKRLSDS